MKRVLTTLVILLVVLAVGMTALIMLVNPNDFRATMVNQVEARSGYRLQLDGDLRWHVWPQLSILSGGISLRAPGATAPVISAENMRLDVKLLPLLSHRLEVKQVMLKGAVVRLTPESESQRPSNAPIAPAGSSTPEDARGWQLAINQLKIVDSLLILQRGDNEQLNVRDINLTLEQDDDRQIALELANRVNRDQRDLSVSLKANLDMQHYPQSIDAVVETFDYQLQGAGIPADGISGSGSLKASYHAAESKVSVNSFTLTANDSQLSGSFAATLGALPDYVLDVKAAKLDLDTLLGYIPETRPGEGVRSTVKTVTPVIATEQPAVADNSVLRTFSAQVTLAADNLVYRGLNINNLNLNATNRAGVVTLSTFTGQLNGGHFALPGKMDLAASPKITLQPLIENVEVVPLTKAFSLPETVSGTLSLTGQLSGDSLTADALMRQWRGHASLRVDNLRFQGVNIQQMIQMAVVRSNGNVQGQDRYERYTEVERLTGNAELNAGQLRVNDINGVSPLLTLNGTSTFNLPAQRCDMNFNVRITDGWRGDQQLVDILRTVSVPLRIYGPFNKLSYQLQVDQLLRKRVQDELKKRLNDWADKNQQSQTGKGLRQLLERL